MADAAEEVMVRRLSTGGSRIRTLGHPQDSRRFFETVLSASAPLSVPPERPPRFARGTDESSANRTPHRAAQERRTGLVQQLIAQPAVEAFDKSILHGIAGAV